MARIKIEDIRAQVESQNWRLISDEYVNLDTIMTFECAEGHRVYAPWKKLRTELKCPECEKSIDYSEQIEVLPKKKGVYRVLALDQATHKSGFAIFDNEILVKCGVFETSLTNEIERCNAIKLWLGAMIDNQKIDFVGLEGIQFQDNLGGVRVGVTTFETLARLQGILMELCFEKKIPFEVCPTNTWRHEIGVKGRTRADKKRSMQLLVKKQYDVTVSDDIADAIGIGQYCARRVSQTNKTESWEVQ